MFIYYRIQSIDGNIGNGNYWCWSCWKIFGQIEHNITNKHSNTNNHPCRNVQDFFSFVIPIPGEQFISLEIWFDFFFAFRSLFFIFTFYLCCFCFSFSIASLLSSNDVSFYLLILFAILHSTLALSSSYLDKNIFNHQSLRNDKRTNERTNKQTNNFKID